MSNPTQDIIEKLAWRICDAAGHNPDMLCYSTVPYQIVTPSGAVWVQSHDPRPLWQMYLPAARLALSVMKEP